MKEQNFISIGANALLPATPVAFLGSYDADNKANIMTAAWCGIVNSQPPIMSVSVRNQRKSYSNILRHKAFTLSIPSALQAKEIDFAGIVSGKSQDKFDILKLDPLMAEHIHAPYVAQCPFVVEMALRSYEDLGSHTLFLGEVMDIKVNSSYVDSDTNSLIGDIDTLLYCPLTREYKEKGLSKGRAFSLGRTIKS